MSAPENQAAHSSSTPCNTLPIQWKPYNHPLIDPYSGNLVYGCSLLVVGSGRGFGEGTTGLPAGFPARGSGTGSCTAGCCTNTGSLPYSSIGTLGKTVTYHDGL